MRWAIVAMCLQACVFKGQHELVEVQLDATRIAMAARSEQCQTDIRGLEDKLDKLTLEIVLRQIQLDELHVRAALRDSELDRLQSERVAVVLDLQSAQERSERLERMLDAERRRSGRRRPVEAPKEPADSEGSVPLTEGAKALADVQAKLHDHYRESLEKAFLDRMNEQAVDAFQGLVDAGNAEVLRIDGATVVRIPTYKLFQEGWGTLSPRGLQITAEAAAALEQIPGRDVSIEAHTDDAPVHSARYPSNWERGFGRAVAVLHAFEAAGIHAKLSATSFAGTRPLVQGHSSEALEANRRVELVITVDPDLATRFAPSEDASDPSRPDDDTPAGSVDPSNEPPADADAERSGAAPADSESEVED